MRALDTDQRAFPGREVASLLHKVELRPKAAHDVNLLPNRFQLPGHFDP